MRGRRLGLLGEAGEDAHVSVKPYQGLVASLVELVQLFRVHIATHWLHGRVESLVLLIEDLGRVFQLQRLQIFLREEQLHIRHHLIEIHQAELGEIEVKYHFCKI